MLWHLKSIFKHLDMHMGRLISQIEEEGLLSRVAFDHLHRLPDHCFHHKSTSPYNLLLETPSLFVDHLFIRSLLTRPEYRRHK